MTYPGTNLPLAPGYPIDQLRSTLLAGPGSTGLYSGATNFLRMSETLTNAADDLSATLGRLSEGLEGPAAAAATQHITALAENGHAGAAQATLAYNGLIEQGDYHLRARQDMQAVPGQPDPEQQHVFAVDSAARYQNNANHTLTDVFQPFVAPAATPIDVAPAASPHAAGWVSPSGVGAAHLGAGGAAGSGSGLPGTPPTGSGTGVTPPGALLPAPGPGPGTPILPGRSTPPTGGPNTGVGTAARNAPNGSSRSTAGHGTAGEGTTPGPGRAPTGVSPQQTSPGGGSFPGSDSVDPTGRNGPGATRPGGPSDERTSRPQVPGYPGTGGPTAQPWSPIGPPSQSWRNSQPWGLPPTEQAPAGPGTGRSGDSRPTESGSGRPATNRPAVPVEPAPGGVNKPASTGRAGTGQGMAPMMGGGGRGQESEHKRPSWLVLDDPQAFWFSGMPAHTSPTVAASPDDDSPPDRANGL